MIKRQEADIIIVTGDVVDSYHPDFGVSLAFLEKCAQTAPTYYITGNREWRFGDIQSFLEKVEAAGVTVLDNESNALERNGEKIMLCGLSGKRTNGYSNYDEEIISKLKEDMSNCFSILLSHYPERLGYYSTLGCDMVFCGHAHGGQFRIPFTNIGIFAPDQGFFPKYVGERYESGNTVMYLSRGLGNSIFPVRLLHNMTKNPAA